MDNRMSDQDDKSLIARLGVLDGYVSKPSERRSYLHDRDPRHLGRTRDDAEDFARNVPQHRALVEEGRAEHVSRDWRA